MATAANALAPRGCEVLERTEKAITRRWPKWLPLAVTFARSISSEYAARRLEQLRLLHRQRCLDCLQRGLSWATIRRRNFDDPLRTEEWYEKRVQAALDRIANAKEATNAASD